MSRPGIRAGREEGVAVPSLVTVAEAAALPAEDVLARLGSRAPGLPGAEAGRRLQVVDPNAVRSHRVGTLSVLASQLGSPLLMLLAVTALASFLGQASDAVTAPTGGRQHATRRAASEAGTPSSRRQASVSWSTDVSSTRSGCRSRNRSSPSRPPATALSAICASATVKYPAACPARMSRRARGASPRDASKDSRPAP